MSKFHDTTSARNLDIYFVLDDATSAAHDAYDDAMLDTALLGDAMLDTSLPLGAFLDAHIARVAARCDDTSETADTIEVELAIMQLLDMHEHYVMEER
ncbi:hypothetical protein ZWY2020_042996 [Hordeum vulgare]|nr:hypothetical protein ZWY2020_042996 [Hordeum vulgare]